MDRVVARFSSHEEAEKVDALYYRQLTPQRRLEILLELIERVHPEFHAPTQGLIELLNSKHVESVIVGGYALAFHGDPRYTGDSRYSCPLFPRERSQAGNRAGGLRLCFSWNFGQGLHAGGTSDSTRISTPASLDGTPVAFIDRELFIRNKMVSGRTRDKADVEALGEL